MTQDELMEQIQALPDDVYLAAQQGEYRADEYANIGASDLKALAARLRDTEQALNEARALIKLFSGTLPKRAGRILAREWMDKYGN